MTAIQQASNKTPGRPSVPVNCSVEPDLEEAMSFLELLDPNGLFTFQTFKDSDSVTGAAQYPKVFHGTLDEHADALTSINQQGGGIFVMVNEGDGNLIEGEKSCRTARNVIRVRAVFVDLDGAPLEPVRKAQVKPSIIVESSPGRWHAYWPLDECPLNQFKPIQMALAAKFLGDPSVNDLCRVMRLPGFLHQKNEPFMTRIVGSNELKGN